MPEGRVIKSTGTWYNVLGDDAALYRCKLKGVFRMKGISSTSPVFVGDKVVFHPEADRMTGTIVQILPRNNYIIRKATRLSKVSHVMASNMDKAFVIVSLTKPRTSTGFIDRFLVTAEAYHIPANIVFNKIDLYDGHHMQMLKDLMDIYSEAGYPCFYVSALTGQNLEILKAAMKGNVNLFAGHSGVGKSALINLIQPGLNLKTEEISEYHGKGLHTTTFIEMHPLAFGGYIIDTPGVKEFGLIDFNRNEVAERFPEFRKYLHLCRFHNCTHVHEPGCAVKQAIENGQVSLLRYENYLSILNDDYWEKQEKDYR
ncbi:MAG: ribosome small subunit-dependent GTPase A [Bacteroidales bacterium]|nr:ribosome small subunit-dependent GTPase A [Bacteroidales bacterium]